MFQLFFYRCQQRYVYSGYGFYSSADTGDFALVAALELCTAFCLTVNNHSQRCSSRHSNDWTMPTTPVPMATSPLERKGVCMCVCVRICMRELLASARGSSSKLWFPHSAYRCLWSAPLVRCWFYGDCIQAEGGVGVR